MMRQMLAGLWLVACLVHAAAADVPEFEAEIVQTFQTFDARQGVAVDYDHFYAINNYSLTKHDKKTGEALLQWDGVSDVDGPLVHLDGGMILDRKLYAAHSNYPIWPMTSSVEIWDTETLEHTGSYSFGIHRGSLTWLDRHEGFWWAGFANYDKVQDDQDHPYGETRNTQVVKMNDDFTVLQAWILPPDVLARMTPMSNSGGSWGSDGFLYLTGHDHPEIYVMDLPVTGSELQWIATVHVPGLNGQGIAWDRSEPMAMAPALWGIHKQDETVFRIRMPEIVPRKNPANYLRRPGEFQTER